MTYIARRARQEEEGVFSLVNRWCSEKKARNEAIINLGEGSPNRTPAPPILQEIVAACRRDETYRYPFILADLPNAISTWYAERFGVSLDPCREILPLWGTQEGLVHLPFALMERGESCLLPDPGYPVYHYLPTLVDGTGYRIPLRKEGGFLPVFSEIPPHVAQGARFLILNFPNNPLGVVAPMETLEEAVAFCRAHDIVLIYDNAYSELTFDGDRAPSVLQVPGAKDVAVELNSVSKTFNLAGIRLGYILGNADVIRALAQLKGNMDFGLFHPTQRAAICALTHPDRDSIIAGVRTMYQERRDAFVESASSLGWEVTPPRGSMFIWTKVPGSDDDTAFARFCIERAGVAIVPGSAFGPNGKGFARIALTQEVPVLQQAARRIGRALSEWHCARP